MEGPARPAKNAWGALRARCSSELQEGRRRRAADDELAVLRREPQAPSGCRRSSSAGRRPAGRAGGPGRNPRPSSNRRLPAGPSCPTTKLSPPSSPRRSPRDRRRVAEGTWARSWAPVMARPVDGRADGKAGLRRWCGRKRSVRRAARSLANDGGPSSSQAPEDAVLRAARGPTPRTVPGLSARQNIVHPPRRIGRRGPRARRRAGRCAESLADPSIAQGHEIAPRHNRGGDERALDAHEEPGKKILEDFVWRPPQPARGRRRTLNQKRYVRLDPAHTNSRFRDRTRTGGHGQDVPRGGGWPALGALQASGSNRITSSTRPRPRRGGASAPRISCPGDMNGQGSTPTCGPLFRTPSHEHGSSPRPGRPSNLDRGVIENRAAGAFMRGQDDQRQLHHPRRGAEHEPGADEG